MGRHIRRGSLLLHVEGIYRNQNCRVSVSTALQLKKSVNNYWKVTLWVYYVDKSTRFCLVVFLTAQFKVVQVLPLNPGTY